MKCLIYEYLRNDKEEDNHGKESDKNSGMCAGRSDGDADDWMWKLKGCLNIGSRVGFGKGFQ